MTQVYNICYNKKMSEVYFDEIPQHEAVVQSDWQQMKPALTLGAKAIALFSSGDTLEVLSEAHLRRGAYPEPFDIAAHIGNFREAGIGTMAAGFAIAMLTMPQETIKRNKSDEKIVKKARIAALGGFFASSAVQVVGEAYGLTNSLVEANTPDALDAVYGIGWSAVIAGVAYRTGMKFMRKHKIIERNTEPTSE